MDTSLRTQHNTPVSIQLQQYEEQTPNMDPKGNRQLLPNNEENVRLLKSSGFSLLEAHTKPGSCADPMYGAAARQILTVMHDLWRQDKQCDVVLVTQDTALKAHKIAMGAYSTDLQDKFRKYAATEVVRINLTDFSTSTVETILRFMYTVEIDINSDNIAQVLRCAMELGVDVIVQLCREFVQHSNIRTALVCYMVSEMAGWADLIVKIHDLILDNFGELAETEDFLRISPDLLGKLMADDRLYVNKELEVFNALCRWVDHERRCRQKHACNLLQHVRLQLIDPEDLATKVESVEFIFSSENMTQCRVQLSDAWKFHALRCNGNTSLVKTFAGKGPRRPRRNRVKCVDEMQNKPRPSNATYPSREYANITRNNKNNNADVTSSYSEEEGLPPPPPTYAYKQSEQNVQSRHRDIGVFAGPTSSIASSKPTTSEPQTHASRRTSYSDRRVDRAHSRATGSRSRAQPQPRVQAQRPPPPGQNGYAHLDADEDASRFTRYESQDESSGEDSRRLYQ